METQTNRKEFTSSTFTWGVILNVHYVGYYTIVEYIDRTIFKVRLKERGVVVHEKDQDKFVRDIAEQKGHVAGSVAPNDAFNDARRFYVYVNGKDTQTASRTFDGALLLAISHRNLTESSESVAMAQGAAKLLEVPRD